jgi:hypothetical protein
MPDDQFLKILPPFVHLSCFQNLGLKQIKQLVIHQRTRRAGWRRTDGAATEMV